MCRAWIGFGLLLVLLAGGILSAWAMVQWHTPLEAALDQAAELATASRWEEAEQLHRQARRQWHRRWHMAAAFADHEPMEAIDSLFAQLEIYGQQREKLGYAALCRELARELGAMGEAHVPNWWNLL